MRRFGVFLMTVVLAFGVGCKQTPDSDSGMEESKTAAEESDSKSDSDDEKKKKKSGGGW